MTDRRFGATLAFIASGATMTQAIRETRWAKREFLAAARASDKLREEWLIYAERGEQVLYWRRRPHALDHDLK